MNRLKINHINIVFDCKEAAPMAEFYNKLLGWEISHPAANGWAAVTSPEDTVIAFQEVDSYEPPIWPWENGKQGQMMHLDYWVDDLEAGVAHAKACGATEAKVQYFKTSRTMLDPAGHTFCIDTDGKED